jgi:MFS family permease
MNHILISYLKGVGIGLVTNLLPAIISQYFGKQRAIACGISYAGATAGAFIFPLFIEWQLKEYGLRGTLLLMGGIRDFMQTMFISKYSLKFFKYLQYILRRNNFIF